MKKMITINFQGRVIPIEETAYDILQQYVESLRVYFRNEEGRDEIINDIESRIAELFSEKLKRGSNCITDDDVRAIMDSIGRPEDFEAAEADTTTTTGGPRHDQASGRQAAAASVPLSRGKLFRNADDKVLGGVCSGLANYMNIDPVVMRVLFILLAGLLFWVYILLWIIVPSQSLKSRITKRLYRNPDGKIIAGVASGLGVYFNIEAWVVRLIFLLPFVLGILTKSIGFFTWHWGPGPRIFSGSFSGTMILAYIILWIVLPYASSAADKLEMRGEKVDLNSIRDTVKEQSSSAQQMAATAKPQYSSLNSVLRGLFKVLFIFIASIIALVLFAVLLAMIFGGMTVFPLKEYILDGPAQNLLAWGAVILFLFVPVVALMTWIIRRIMGIRSTSRNMGYVFGTLWVAGLLCVLVLSALVARNFKTKSSVEENIPVLQPRQGKLLIDVEHSSFPRHYANEWFDVDIDADDDMPFFGLNPDSMLLNTVRLNIVKSKDSLYHLHKIQLGRGENIDKARRVAEHIEFNVKQRDSLLTLASGFVVKKSDKFRNQQVLLIVEVPEGKKIVLGEDLDKYKWFDINVNQRRRNAFKWQDSWEKGYRWEAGSEYLMTGDGLERLPRIKENT